MGFGRLTSGEQFALQVSGLVPTNQPEFFARTAARLTVTFELMVLSNCCHFCNFNPWPISANRLEPDEPFVHDSLDSIG